MLGKDHFMISIARTRAQEHFAAIEKRQQAALSEQEEAAFKISEKTARLRALRLARDTKKPMDSHTKQHGAKKRPPASTPR